MVCARVRKESGARKENDMPRIAPVDPERAEGKAKALLEAVKKQNGGVPNLLRALAAAPAALEAYLGFSSALARGSLRARTREAIALAVSEANRCEYCLAAHTALGKGAGLSEAEMAAARRGDLADAKERGAVALARRIVETEGWASDEDLAAARSAGLSEGEVAEVVANAALTIFTNYFNHVAGTELDFPAAPAL